jgi:hypothetical protein
MEEFLRLLQEVGSGSDQHRRAARRSDPWPEQTWPSAAISSQIAALATL